MSKPADPSTSWVASSPGLMAPLVLGPLVVGLLIYIYTFCSQRQNRRVFGQSLLLSVQQREAEFVGAQNTHLCAFTLLLSDAVTAIFGITMVILLLTFDCVHQILPCIITANIWLAFRWLSLSQHLITALISVLFLHRPKWGFGLRTLGKVLDVIPFLLVMISFRVSENVILGVDVFNLLVMIAIVVICLLNSSSALAKQRKRFGLLALSVYVFVCLPNSVIGIMMFFKDDLPQSIDFLYITNFYFIMDAVLFYLVLTINEDERQYEGAIQSA